MNFDLRIPIGLMFSVYGIMLTVYGAISSSDKELYKRSLDININLIWGILLLVFGAFMLAMAYRGAKLAKLEAKDSSAKR